AEAAALHRILLGHDDGQVIIEAQIPGRKRVVVGKIVLDRREPELPELAIEAVGMRDAGDGVHRPVREVRGIARDRLVPDIAQLTRTHGHGELTALRRAAVDDDEIDAVETRYRLAQ